MLAVLIVFFCSTASTLSVSAEEVTPSNTYDTAYFQNYFEEYGLDTTRFSLAGLDISNYVVVMQRDLTSNHIYINFLSKDNDDSFYLYSGELQSIPYDNYPIRCSNSGSLQYIQGYSKDGFFYQYQYNAKSNQYVESGKFYGSDVSGIQSKLVLTFQSGQSNVKEEIIVSDLELYNTLVDTGKFFYDTYLQSPTSNLSELKYAPNMFASFASIFGGYTGEILDTSVSGLLSEKGIDAPSTIYDDYKNKLYYMQNNDLSMVFMNNAEAPSYKKEDYNGIYECAKKYTFTYAKAYDVIVFFPQYQKYLKFDDWWNANAKGGIDWGAWGNLGIIDVIISTNDKSKTFYLTSDWDVTFNDTGGAAYSGTRVIMSWDSEYGETLDSNTMMKPWEDNSETLKNQGWQEGRPNDMNYPFCIDYYMNGMPTTRIYLNSKPKVEVERISDTKCSYKICMLGTYGYFYDVLSDMYCSFDFTVNYDIENPYGLTFVDIYNDYLEAIHINYVSLGDEFQLELWENYKGNDTYYTGTQVFFNWDIRTNWYNSLRDDTFDYNKIIRDSIGGYVDNNGNQHGGNLSDYADSDLNKNNDNGNKQENNSTPSADGFQFTSEGIFAYCGEFFNFIKYIFDLFPAWIWLIIGTFITVLIMLRVLGR